VKRRIRWTPLALRDLLEIKDYIHRDKTTAAKAEAERIRRSVERLSAFPESGRKLEAVPGIREVVSGNYHVYYRVRPAGLDILRVYHGKRKGLF
jgi:toxin ParE1/3/4